MKWLSIKNVSKIFLLLLGEYIQVGKGTSFGLGKYKIGNVEECDGC